MMKTIHALFRIKQLLRIEHAALVAVQVGREMNSRMAGTPPLYEDSYPPDGGHYDRLWVYVSAISDAANQDR